MNIIRRSLAINHLIEDCRTTISQSFNEGEKRSAYLKMEEVKFMTNEELAQNYEDAFGKPIVVLPDENPN